jgi:hypothetical protein
MRYALCAAAAGAMLGGCAGGPSQSTPMTGAPQNALRSPIGNPTVKDHCPAHGGARVSPCGVDLNASNPGPVTVTTRNPRSKKGTFTESDDCGGPSGVATVALVSGDQWTVAAGSTAGTCTAEFDYTNSHGKKVGWAQLAITNEL